MCHNPVNCPRRLALAQPGDMDDFGQELAHSLGRHGGLIPLAELQARLLVPAAADMGPWLQRRGLRRLAWRAQQWVPAFQLAADGLTPRADVAAVADELPVALDELGILAWFAQPNLMLDGEPPVACLDARLPAVLEAARLEYFLVSG
ncbi:MAG: hypothetical protein DI603_02220 [Roseateles depolymerans]|uniref:Uncharacterized protein n=1 Tax=Roseateles depolymerans TaxID=76731 RepID=A0A2W5G435_9BURK|nr:MAG: hypothetical protein DI603_02220 [Roseateles depolymerans]